MSNPFQPIDPKVQPKEVVTDYHKDSDEFIISYGVVQRVEMKGDKDTDFIIHEDVVETERVKRQDYISSFEDDVGILNIMKKVALSGDTSLLNQTGRISLPGDEKDALGRNVEDLVDVSKYQVDTITALESYKNGSIAFDNLDPELKKKLSFEAVAHLSDEEIDNYLKGLGDAIRAKQQEMKVAEGGTE